MLSAGRHDPRCATLTGMTELTRSTPLPADLRGWTILSLRPSGEHASLRRAAASLGARVIAVSPMALRPMAAGDTLDRALAADRIVFSSPAAVRFAGAQRTLAAGHRRIVLAVGAGTAAALAARGIDAVYPRQQMTSEGLLALPEMQHLQALTVGLITAPGGRGLLADALRQRARQLHVAEVYRRVARTIGADVWARLASASAPLALMLSSGEALDSALGQCPDAVRKVLAGAVVVAASARLQQHATQAGFKRVVGAASARPTAMLAALAGFHAQSRFR